MSNATTMERKRQVPQEAPPHDPDAEQAVLGAMLVDPGALELAARELRAPDFFSERHRLIFTAAVEMQPAPVDIVTLSAELKRRNANWHHDAGGYPYLQEMALALPTTANVAAYVDILRRLSLQRRALQAAYRLIDRAPGLTPEDVPDVLAELELDLHAATEQAASRLKTAAEILALPKQEYIIDGILPEDAQALIYGPPNCGKTFVVLDMAACIAQGIPWQGREVKQGAVVYIIGEGLGGISKRLAAWQTAHNVDPLNAMYFYDSAVQFAEPAEVDRLLTQLRVDVKEPLRLVVADTLSRCAAGLDENSSGDMGQFFNGVDRIRQEFGCCIVIVHHANKAGTGERGSTAIRGGPSAVASVTKTDDLILLEAAKQRDDVLFDAITMRLQPMAESCVVIAADPQTRPAELTSDQKKALRVLAEMPPDSATFSEWRESAKIPERSMYRVRENLEQKKLIVRSGKGRDAIFSVHPAILPTLPNLLGRHFK